MKTQSSRSAAICALCVVLSGCINTATTDSWGAAHWPDGADLRQAATRAVKDPLTWAPLVGAALLGIGNADDSVSDWAVRKTPLFGSHARDASDTLLDISLASYYVTALVAPSASLRDKATGLVIGAGTIALNNGITQGLKSAVGRERPNGRDDRSFPSGHASNAATGATLAAANLAYMGLPQWAETSLKIGFYSVAGGAAWARVEAEQHHVSDVLVGYALGHFVASFMQAAFFSTGVQQPSVSFAQIANGGAITLHMPLGPRPHRAE